MAYRLGLLLAWLLCLAAALVSLGWMLLAIIPGGPRAWRIAIAFDQLANATTGGDEDWTISARCWRYREEQPYQALRWMIDAAFALMGQQGHCQAAYGTERVKAGRLLEDTHL